uniref:Uncharacterized protein n=1 Tax=Vitis vinifera TaxID=29760 RepID=F6HW73_VITVI
MPVSANSPVPPPLLSSFHTVNCAQIVEAATRELDDEISGFLMTAPMDNQLDIVINKVP